MLKPTKHLNLDTSVLYVSSLLLKWLSKKRLMSYADLYRRLELVIGNDARTVFLPTLSYLYLINKIEYHDKTDAFEYREIGIGR
jgi:ABC-three component (ABC-3C) system Middle Component 8